MTANRLRSRAGITLTEILISIMIMGIGLVSLATLFPLGLIRLRQANQLDRSSFLVESAIADMGSRDLLNKSTFLNSWYGGILGGVPYDPFVRDTPLGAVGTEVTASLGGGGLPVCYDPLLRSVTQAFPLLPTAYYNPYLPAALAVNNGPNSTHPRELRFGAGVVANGATMLSFVRNDPSGGLPSAHGLQRITNFLPYTAATITWPLTYNSPTLSPLGSRDLAADTFTSPDDVVFHENGATPYNPFDPIAGSQLSGPTGNSPPRMTTPMLNGAGQILNDWKYTWFFTGRQTDVSNGTVFDGDIVICDGRPLAEEQRTSLNGQPAWVASGEFVMEAIFGYSNTVFPSPTGYSVSNDRTVLLRWPSSQPDPEIKIGNWIADVTYERTNTVSAVRLGAAMGVAGISTNIPVYPMQRCHWYQVAKRTDIQVEDASMTAPVSGGYRRMVVYLTSPVKSKTLIKPGTDAVFLNVALYMPSVINVFPRTVFSRNTK